MKIDRRRFIQAGGSAAGVMTVPGLPLNACSLRAAAEKDDRVVRLSGDGVGLTPAQYAQLLNRVADEKGVAPDSYSLGGVVEELEEQCARVLGKERAVFMPTGTLANHMAVRAL